jgi:hypothetical protein
MGNHLINETLMEEEEETFQTSAASHLKCLLPLHSDIIIKNNAPFFKELFPFVELFNPWNSLSTSDCQHQIFNIT